MKRYLFNHRYSVEGNCKKSLLDCVSWASHGVLGGGCHQSSRGIRSFTGVLTRSSQDLAVIRGRLSSRRLLSSVAVHGDGDGTTQTPAPPPPYEIPELPPNLKFKSETIFSPREETEAAFQYNIQKGPKFAPYLAFTDELKFTASGTFPLSDAVFNSPVRKDIVHRVVRWQRANRRKGIAVVKKVGDVRGSGKKPHAQKGLGRARQGSRFAPHMRGGGRAFQKRTDWKHKLQKKVRRFGLRSTLNARFIENQLFVVDSFTPPSLRKPKRGVRLTGVSTESQNFGSSDADMDADKHESDTDAIVASSDNSAQNSSSVKAAKALIIRSRHISTIIEEMGWKSVAFIDKERFSRNFKFAQKSLDNTEFFAQSRANVYDILKCKTVVLSREGLRQIQDRLDEKKQKERKFLKRAAL